MDYEEDEIIKKDPIIKEFEDETLEEVPEEEEDDEEDEDEDEESNE